jgi:hypothetical protein
MKEKDLYMRRTGVAFLSLVMATNCVPWMELVTGRSATADLTGGPSGFIVAVVTCFLAALLVIVAWLSGRRRSVPPNPRIARPRDAGLVFAILASALNLALAGAIRWLGENESISFQAEFVLFAGTWYLLSLPLQLFAGFYKGRASIPAPRPAPSLPGTA